MTTTYFSSSPILQFLGPTLRDKDTSTSSGDCHNFSTSLFLKFYTVLFPIMGFTKRHIIIIKLPLDFCKDILKATSVFR